MQAARACMARPGSMRPCKQRALGRVDLVALEPSGKLGEVGDGASLTSRGSAPRCVPSAVLATLGAEPERGRRVSPAARASHGLTPGVESQKWTRQNSAQSAAVASDPTPGAMMPPSPGAR